jgi:hypothetical protein
MTTEARNIFFNDIVAFSDRYVIGNHNDLFFLSIYGNTQSVNAILSAAANYRALEVQLTGEPLEKLSPELARKSPGDQYITVERANKEIARICNFKSQRLSWGRAHGFWFDVLCDLRSSGTDFVVIGNDKEEAQLKLYQVLDSRPIPLLESWKDKLIEILELSGYADELISFGCHAYLVRYDENGIISLLSNGIRKKIFPLR